MFQRTKQSSNRIRLKVELVISVALNLRLLNIKFVICIILGPSTELKSARVFCTADSATQRRSVATTILSVLRHSVILPSTPNSEVKNRPIYIPTRLVDLYRWSLLTAIMGPLSLSLSLVVTGGSAPVAHHTLISENGRTRCQLQIVKSIQAPHATSEVRHHHQHRCYYCNYHYDRCCCSAAAITITTITTTTTTAVTTTLIIISICTLLSR